MFIYGLSFLRVKSDSSRYIIGSMAENVDILLLIRDI